jgi:hypothetical protein
MFIEAVVVVVSVDVDMADGDRCMVGHLRTVGTRARIESTVVVVPWMWMWLM